MDERVYRTPARYRKEPYACPRTERRFLMFADRRGDTPVRSPIQFGQISHIPARAPNSRACRPTPKVETTSASCAASCIASASAIKLIARSGTEAGWNINISDRSKLPGLIMGTVCTLREMARTDRGFNIVDGD